jgi:hypothetical protein
MWAASSRGRRPCGTKASSDSRNCVAAPCKSCGNQACRACESLGLREERADRDSNGGREASEDGSIGQS